MARWFVLLFAAMTVSGAVLAPPATAIDAPIGRLGETLRVEFKGVVADVTVHDVLPSDVPPGFGYPPRAPRYQVYRANVTVHAVEMPVPYAMGLSFSFKGVTPTGDAYEPRNSDSPDALQYALLNVPAGSDRQRRRVVGLLPRPGVQRRADRQGDGIPPRAVEPVVSR